MKIPYKDIVVGGETFRVPDLSKMFGGWWLLLGIVALIYLLSGIYIVGPDQKGVIRTFGKMSRITSSGLHYRLPMPFEQLDKPKVTEIKRIEIGFRSRGPNNAKTQTRDVPQESLMLTGGLNMVDIDLIIQYKIADPVKYLFHVRNVPMTVHFATEAVIRQVVGIHPIDEVLTTGKGMIQATSKVLLQDILDSYECGVAVVQVQLQDVQPPRQVADAFREVASAKEDKARLVNEAQGYRNNLIPKARGEAAENVLQAEGYAAQRVTEAEGDAANFLAQLAQYKKSPNVTRIRMLLETMEDILPGINKYILKTQSGGDLINIIGAGVPVGNAASSGSKGGVR
ncbi:MAG: FtsH protease activity modulator HflK [Candidatus Electryonea clarkiae]|nr:FtsH protease activity modulator HflK [Candidatus Electryonea clarkiae]MDP8285568.1 FtsH protease activity modulator HflK [Candidatus Electryonea clarkiae]